jgi:hypothetical protein
MRVINQYVPTSRVTKTLIRSHSHFFGFSKFKREIKIIKSNQNQSIHSQNPSPRIARDFHYPAIRYLLCDQRSILCDASKLVVYVLSKVKHLTMKVSLFQVEEKVSILSLYCTRSYIISVVSKSPNNHNDFFYPSSSHRPRFGIAGVILSRGRFVECQTIHQQLQQCQYQCRSTNRDSPGRRCCRCTRNNDSWRSGHPQCTGSYRYNQSHCNLIRWIEISLGLVWLAVSTVASPVRCQCVGTNERMCESPICVDPMGEFSRRWIFGSNPLLLLFCLYCCSCRNNCYQTKQNIR